MPVAIVTAGDSGIGKATCVLLAQRGFDVGLTWHADDEGARDTAAQVEAAGRRAAVARLDLGDATDGPPDRHADDRQRGRRPAYGRPAADPAGRPGHADEIAEVVAFLASPGARYVTGASYVADGGLLLMAAVANQED